MAAGNRAEVMIATHNQASIEHAVSLMRKLGIRRRDGVSFGQLLGMADNITFPLGTGGYKVNPHLPRIRPGGWTWKLADWVSTESVGRER